MAPVFFLRATAICFLLLSALVSAVTQPNLGSEALNHYESSHAYISSRYPQGIPPPHPSWRVEYYSHLLAGHSTAERDAWRLSQTQGYGPVHVSYGHRAHTAYVTTKIPRGSDLGGRWGLNHAVVDGEGRRSYKDLYAFWKMDQSGVKLMRLDAWKEGGQTPQILTWDAVRGLIRSR